MKTELLTKATRLACKVGFELKKNSPTILAGLGTIGVGVGTVMACKATTKAGAIKAKMKEDMDAIQYCIENAEKIEEGYTEKDAKQDTVGVYAQTAMAYAKLYGPAILTTGLSLALIWKGHNILTKRNAGLLATVKVLDTSFKKYRGRVVDRFGKELDYELLHGIKAQEIERTTTLEDGTEVVEKEVVNVVDPNEISMYAKFFDEACPAFSKVPNANYSFLVQQQQAANRRLRQNGHMYLNEVYDLIGIPRTPEGQIVGWVYDSKYTEDDFISFGMHDDPTNERKRAFVNGRERAILLDFNVQGPIIDLM